MQFDTARCSPRSAYFHSDFAKHSSLRLFWQAETTRLRTQVSDLEGALNQARRDTEEVRQVELEARAREAQALSVAKNVQEQAVVQRAYADELALENDRLAREGQDLARLINDKELSEQRLNEHIRNLDANNVKMQKVMYETHARAEQMQLERDSALVRARDLEDRLNQALHREEALKSENMTQAERLKRYEDALNQLNGWPLVAESTRALPVPTPPPPVTTTSHTGTLNPLGSSYAKSAAAAATSAQAAANLASAHAAANAAAMALPVSAMVPTVYSPRASGVVHVPAPTVVRDMPCLPLESCLFVSRNVNGRAIEVAKYCRKSSRCACWHPAACRSP